MRTMACVALSLLLWSLCAIAQEPLSPQSELLTERVERSIDPFRRGAHLLAEPTPPPIAHVEDNDVRRARGWPEQPPTIPHAIHGYQLDRNSNRCMVCHSRAAAEQFQAPMISVTHFMDRSGQVLAQLSPRRWFCTQCHVVQSTTPNLVENRFIDIDALLDRRGLD